MRLFPLLSTFALVSPLFVTPKPIFDFDAEYEYINKIDAIVVPPLAKSTQTTNISIKISFSMDYPPNATLEISIFNTRHQKGLKLTSYNLPSKGNTINYAYSNSFNDYKTDQLIFTMKSDLGNDQVSVNPLWTKYKSISLEEGDNQIDSGETIVKYTRKDGFVYSNEIIEFDNVEKDVYNEYLSSFDVSLFTFKYLTQVGLSPTFDYCSLVIYHNGPEFSNIGTTVADIQTTLDLVLLFGKEDYAFKFKNKMYVDPITYEMDSTKKAGYLETDRLFFPKATTKENTRYRMVFILKDFGVNKYYISHSFYITSLGKFMGNCKDSLYCVSTEDATPDIGLGTQISH